MAHSLSKEETHEVFKTVVRSVTHKLNIHVEEQFNLRTPRADMRTMAKVNWTRHKARVTLFVNVKGDKAVAVEAGGVIHLLPDSPEYLHALRAPEHAINYFVNEMRRSMKFFFTLNDFQPRS